MLRNTPSLRDLPETDHGLGRSAPHFKDEKTKTRKGGKVTQDISAERHLNPALCDSKCLGPLWPEAPCALPSPPPLCCGPGG